MNLTNKRLRDCATQQEVRNYLEEITIWTLRDNAAYLGVTPSFYRRNIRPLPNHPTPIDEQAKNDQWFGKEMMPYLDDVSNLKRPQTGGRAA